MDDDTGPAADKRICLGVITGARGLKGDVWIRTFTAEPADIAAYGAPSDEAGRRYLLSVVERRSDRVVARIEGIEDRTAAEALKSTRLYIERAALPVPNADEFYHADLIGCVALVAERAEAGAGAAVIGKVSAVHDFGGGAVLEIEFATGASLLVPFTRACVPDVDVVRGRVRIIPPPGLLPEGRAAEAPAEGEMAAREAANEE